LVDPSVLRPGREKSLGLACGILDERLIVAAIQSPSKELVSPISISSSVMSPPDFAPPRHGRVLAARRGGRLKRFGDIFPLLPADPRLILAIDQANRKRSRPLAK
jgi:hypothetical protein